MSSKQADARAAIALLAEMFPKAFVVHEATRRPLKVGIAADLVAAVNGAIKPPELVAALRVYCNNKVYLVHLRAGAVRIDLNGDPAGLVTAAEAARAAEQLTTRLLRAAARKKLAPLVQAPPAQAPVPATTGPRRLGLADLKQLAVLRRQAGAGGG
jgi:ProP effector